MTGKVTAGLVAAVAVVVSAVSTLGGQQLTTPPDWKWRPDTAASVTDSLNTPANAITFVAMPPGWHVTTGPGALLYHPGYVGKGNFSVEAEIFLFSGESQNEYGIFLGGNNLDAKNGPSYIAFLARRDGKAAVLQRAEDRVYHEWMENGAVAPQTGTANAKNILRVDVNAADVVFSANGKEIVKLPRAKMPIEGNLGFRIGKDINIHASRLDVTHRLAPVPVK